jgi:hypothetical protein
MGEVKFAGNLQNTSPPGFGVPQKAGVERRRCFRIDDEVILVIRRLDQNRVDEELSHFEERRNSFCLVSNVALEQEKLSILRHSLESRHPDMMQYIAYLEERINFLSGHIVQDKNELPEPAQQINISAQGMRFYTEESYDKDELLEMRICLQPDQKRLLIIGNVVWCLKDPNSIGRKSNAVAVDFTYIDETDRDVLLEHIQKKQNKISGL